jgi:hypothetical protein
MFRVEYIDPRQEIVPFLSAQAKNLQLGLIVPFTTTGRLAARHWSSRRPRGN